MDIYSVIVEDHNEAKAIMAKIMAARSEASRERLIAELRQAILLHAKTEEATFYERLRQEPELAEKMEHASEEHEVVEGKLNKIKRFDADADRWVEMFGEIKADLEHHMKEEEEDIFKKAKKLISAEEAKALGERMQELKLEETEAA